MGTVLRLRLCARRVRWRTGCWLGRWLTRAARPMKFCGTALASLGAAVLTLALPAAALAHEHRTVHGYELTVGFNVEPAYIGQINGAFLQVMKPAAPGAEGSGDGHGDKESEGGHAHAAMMPVEGLESTLKVLVAAGGSEAREFPLRAVFGAPGTYVGDFVPTRTGSYIFTFTGTIEGDSINERFESGPGRFDDVRATTTIQFPEPLPSSAELREELAVARAAIRTAQALAFGGLGAGAAAVLAAGMAMLMASRRR